MKTKNASTHKSSENIIRGVIELCADCDTCRPIMDEACLFFPELYRLWDREKESGVPITAAELRSMMELCTLCGLCPCPKIPADVMKAKARYVEEKGLSLSVRLLNDVPRLARLCSIFPRLVNALQSNKACGSLLKKVAHIHPERKLLMFPEENFFAWAADKGLSTRREGGRNVAYFAGCSAGYLFPQIGRATVAVLERNGINIYLPPQECCGMPQLVEGDRTATLQRTQSNMDYLLAAVRAGDDLVTSCPTCGYFMKVLLRERAFYAESYQRSVNAGEDEIKVPDQDHGTKKHKVLKKSMYKDILKDDGYFSSLDPIDRIDLSDHLHDAGEYLARLHAEGRFDTNFTVIPWGQMVYFAPCHQRQQQMGRPYPDLLRLIPGMAIEPVGSESECCGMGGNLGFKAGFHEKSLVVGSSLMEKIRAKAPQAIITDCMSCRLQFMHALPYPVFHPMEVLSRAYQADDTPPVGGMGQ